MEKNEELRKIIASCDADKIIELITNNTINLNMEIDASTEKKHWILYLYDKCDKSVLNYILNSKIIHCDNLKTKDNISLVWKAYSDQKYDLVEMLLKCGASALKDDFSLLHWVSSNGDTEILKLILLENKNLNLDKKDIDGNEQDRTPLHWAAQENQIEVGKILIEYGADINIKDIDGKTPLHIAAAEGHKEFVNLLLNAGANKNIVDNFNLTAKDYAKLYEHKNIQNIIENN